MPAKFFICPDGVTIEKENCYTSCRMKYRCLTLPTLLAVGEERPLTGTPSVTQLMKGTRELYLASKNDYAIDPVSRAYSLLGQKHHEQLELNVSGSLQEVQVSSALGFTGTPDIVEPDPTTPDHYILTDYKTYGSYRIAKMLGLQSKKSLHPTEVYKTSGRWGQAGNPKTITEWYQDPDKADCADAEIQLNGYRLILEASGWPISHMQIQATVRDGGLKQARERGVNKPIYIIPIRKLPDIEIANYFIAKKVALRQALETDTEPPPCNDLESWGKRKCKDFCEVRDVCSQGIRFRS